MIIYKFFLSNLLPFLQKLIYRPNRKSKNMPNKVARREGCEPILEDMATFALEQVNSVKPMLFKDYLIRDNYTTASRRKTCLCLKKLRDGYTEITDIVEIQIKFGDRIVDYYICASSKL